MSHEKVHVHHHMSRGVGKRTNVSSKATDTEPWLKKNKERLKESSKYDFNFLLLPDELCVTFTSEFSGSVN